MTAFDPARTPALEIDRVSHRYGTRVALNDVSLTVRQSSFTVLLGLNGAGKSTLFSLITRLYAIRSGQIRIFGHDVANEPGAALSKLGVVFQSRALDIDISVRQNLLYHAALHGIARKHADQLIAQVLDRVAMADRSARSGRQPLDRADAANRDCPRVAASAATASARRADGRPRHQGTRRHSRPCSPAARPTEGIGVLWATHLIDEAGGRR